MSDKIILTNQRDLLLEYVQNNHTHPTAEDIYKHLKKKLPRLSKKTVYNNLKLLCDKGIIQEINARGVRRYEPVMSPHHHLVCRVCDKVFDIEEKDLTEHAMDVGKKIKDFEVLTTTTHFYGICKKCKERRK
jgi:Fur family transcriptional regulator, ferric uptake regulator